jgi:hypothetical protein
VPLVLWCRGFIPHRCHSGIMDSDAPERHLGSY